MRFPSREIVKDLREKYPAGTRVELISMDDIQSPQVGTRGTIRGVDDAGSIMVLWDSGSSLSLIYKIDNFRVLDDE